MPFVNEIITLIVTYLSTTILGYIIHRIIHNKFAGVLYESHNVHHTKLYPPGKLISDKYLSAGKNSSVWVFTVTFFPFLLIPVWLFVTDILTLNSMLLSISLILIIGFMNAYVHDSFHIKNHWLAKVIPRYHKLQELHFVHHVNMKKNFGIYEFWCDKLFRTYREPRK